MAKMIEIIEKIKTASIIAILPHVDPDGDCLGSSFALALALKKMGKTPHVILENGRPAVYEFLKGEYVNYADLSTNINFDTVICLDSSDEGRLATRYSLLKESRTTINIDHHITNTQYAQNNYVDANAAATGEIIFELINQLQIPIDSDIAANLYVAVSTDTGGFRYSNTTSKTHKIIAQLLETNINIAEINRKVFETVSLTRLKLTANAINVLQLYQNGRVGIIVLDTDLMEKIGASDDDTEGLTGLPRTVEGVEVGIIIKEKEPGIIKVSFRSNEYIDVAEIALSLGGGGHKRASGCTLKMDIDTAVKTVLQKVEESFSFVEMQNTKCKMEN